MAGNSDAAYTPRDLAEQTLDGTLPYEETWRENALNVLTLIESRKGVVDALAQAVEALDVATEALRAEGKLPERAILTAKLLDATRELRATVGNTIERGDDA